MFKKIWRYVQGKEARCARGIEPIYSVESIHFLTSVIQPELVIKRLNSDERIALPVHQFSRRHPDILTKMSHEDVYLIGYLSAVVDHRGSVKELMTNRK